MVAKKLFHMTRKVALVTGANRGIGLEIVKQLAQKGFIVYLGTRNIDLGKEEVDKLNEEGLTGVKLLLIDVTNDDSVAQAATAFQAQEDYLDVLINNAAILMKEDIVPAYDVSVEVIKATYEVNVFGVVRATTAFVPLLKKSSSPIILNISSERGSNTLQNDETNLPLFAIQVPGYNSSKAALNHYTITIAHSFPEARVNVIHPGFVATKMNNYSGILTTQVSAEGVIKYGIMIDKNNGHTGSFLSYDGSVLPW